MDWRKFCFVPFTRDMLIKVVDLPEIVLCEQTFKSLVPHAKNLSEDRYDPKHWCYEGYCAESAVLLVYPIVKNLYPFVKFKLCVGNKHNVIIGDESMIFDFIIPELGISEELLDSANEPKLINEEDISQWWCENMLNGEYDPILDLIDEIVTGR